MKTELICIGTELLLGHQNTNSTYIGDKLAGIGLSLSMESSVLDNRDALCNIFHDALKRSDIIITTGGLGPTFDDLTREAMADALGKKLVFNKEMMHKIAAFFASRDIDMPSENDRQAYIIEGSEIIENNIGTACGMIIKIPGKKIIIMLPGPPIEMHTMMKETVLPFLKEKFSRTMAHGCTLHISGLSESEVNERIQHIVEVEKKLEGAHIRFGILAHPASVDIKILIEGKNGLIIDEVLKKTKQEFYDALGDNIYGENEQTLESVTGYLLGKRRGTLAIAESCTGGLVSHCITNVRGSSLYFKGSVIAYSNRIKESILDVDKQVLAKHGAVSRECALEMAIGIRKLYNVTYGLSITGIAGPDGGTSEKPVGLVYIALVSDKGESVEEYKLGGHRLKIKEKAAMSALDMLRRSLLSEKSRN